MKELVLLGGGHAHVEVLRRWGHRPVPGVRLTLVSKDLTTPYSGMLPGFTAGHYSFADAHIDLRRLGQHAKAAAVIQAEASGIDIQARHVLLPGRPPLPYDVLSINTGIAPAAAGVPGAAQHATPVKPIDRFAARLDALLARLPPETPLALAVVGGGAGGVELALALAFRLQQERGRSSSSSSTSVLDTVELFCSGRILPGHCAAAAAAIRRQAAVRRVQLHEHSAVVEVQQRGVVTGDGVLHAADEVLWCTQAAPPDWLRQTGLPVDPPGFLMINDCLQSDGGPPEVFAAGDVATSTNHPRPKAGVYAVRQGPPLYRNLCSFLRGEPLAPWVPQRGALALISAGDKYAVASRGCLAIGGTWVWHWKDWIDRAFMRRYSEGLLL